jgi:hypothetical protein
MNPRHAAALGARLICVIIGAAIGAFTGVAIPWVSFFLIAGLAEMIGPGGIGMVIDVFAVIAIVPSMAISGVWGLTTGVQWAFRRSK